jgi:hypothetical protein
MPLAARVRTDEVAPLAPMLLQNDIEGSFWLTPLAGV